MTKRVAIIGGGIAGLTAAWQVAEHARAGADLEATLFEASPRLGGIVETVHRDGFVIECGPDAWVSEKPWARQLAVDLGLEHDLIPSNDRTRKTHILLEGSLETMPDGMRMMVPTNLDAVDRSHLFSTAAKQAYRDELTRAAELRFTAPQQDESIASFTRRHFGEEILGRVAAPLLSGVLGGDVEQLSVQAILPQFVAMERQHGSVIAGFQARTSEAAGSSIFTTLRGGLGTLIDRLTEEIPPGWLRRNTPVASIAPKSRGWTVVPHTSGLSGAGKGASTVSEEFDAVFVATSPQVSRNLLGPIDSAAASLLDMEATSAIIVAFGYLDAPSLVLPPGFGFLVPPSTSPSLEGRAQLLACTFVDQKFPGRTPSGGRLLRAFFGGAVAERLLRASDEHISHLAESELTRILGPLPTPALSLARRWPGSLPQYAVGHVERMFELDQCVAALPGLTLLGNAYRGVGLPDLIRDARTAADRIAIS